MKRLFLVYTLLLSLPSVTLFAATPPRMIDAAEWTFNSGQVGNFDPIRASRQGDIWTLMPGANKPHDTFGWIQGPTVTVDPATDGIQGNKAGFRLVFDVDTGIGGGSPELRARMNSFNYGLYAIGGITHAGFVETYPRGGVGVLEVEFDRSLIDEPTDFKLYIDLLSYQEQGLVNPNWEVKILSTEYFTTVSNSSFARGDLFSLVYVDSDRDVYGYYGGARNRVKIHNTASNAGITYCYDGAFVAVIEDGKLSCYTLLDDLQEHRVSSSSLINQAGISDQHVGYVDVNGRAYYYNILTGEKRNVSSSPVYAAAVGGGDGALLFVRGGTFPVDVYQYDTRLENPSLEKLNNPISGGFVNTRSSGAVYQTKAQSALVGANALFPGF